MTTADLQAEQLRMIDSAAAINALLGGTIISPRHITVQVHRLSADFLRECDEIVARKKLLS